MFLPVRAKAALSSRLLAPRRRGCAGAAAPPPLPPPALTPPVSPFHPPLDCRDLDLGDSELDRVLLGLPNKTAVMWLNGNGFSRLPARAFAAYPRLEELHLHNNPLLNSFNETSFDGLAHLETLTLHFTNLTKGVPHGMFSQLSALKTLWLHRAHLSSVDATTFAGLGNLEALTLHHNALEALPDGTFGHVPLLNDLTLHENTYVVGDKETSTVSSAEACCALRGLAPKAKRIVMGHETELPEDVLACGCGGADTPTECAGGGFDQCIRWDVAPAGRAALSSVAALVALALGARR